MIPRNTSLAHGVDAQWERLLQSLAEQGKAKDDFLVLLEKGLKKQGGEISQKI